VAKQSAGLLLFHRKGGRLEVFLVHPGGPIWARRDAHAWSIPKGEFGPDEDALTAAKREFYEETGFQIEGVFLQLPPLKQPGGKIVHAFAVEADCDPAAIRSNSFTMEWPPKSGKLREFPEVDRAAWFDIETARAKLHRGQVALLDALQERLRERASRIKPSD
jgi:predicted NUDIX family NTP pyrophosphohydrolase